MSGRRRTSARNVGKKTDAGPSGVGSQFTEDIEEESHPTSDGFVCPFRGIDGCKSRKHLTKRYWLDHVRNRHLNWGSSTNDYREILRENGAAFSSMEVTLSQINHWICGDCLHVHTVSTRCQHEDESVVEAPDQGEDYIIYNIPRPSVSVSDNVQVVVAGVGNGQGLVYDIQLLDRFLRRKFRTVKSIPFRCRLGFSRILKVAIDRVLAKPDDVALWVQLLLLPGCILGTTQISRKEEEKGSSKKKKQWSNTALAIQQWKSPGGMDKMILEIFEADEQNKKKPIKKRKKLSIEELNRLQCKRKVADGLFSAAIRVLSSAGIAPENDDTLQELANKHPVVQAPALPSQAPSADPITSTKEMVINRLKSFPRGTSCGKDGLRAQHILEALSGEATAVADDLLTSITAIVNLFLRGSCPRALGEYVASAPLTPLLKPGGGIRPIAVGTVWRRLVSKVAAMVVSKSMESYFEGLQFGVGLSGGGEAVLHSVNRLVEDRKDHNDMTLLLVDFKNAFNLIDRTAMIREVHLRCPSIVPWVEFCYAQPARLYYGKNVLWSCQGVQQGDPLGPLLFALTLHPLATLIREKCDLALHAWYLDDGTLAGDTLVVAKALSIIIEEGPQHGLHLNVDKTEIYWPNENPRSREPDIFPPNIARPLHGVKLLGGPVTTNVEFGKELALSRVKKTIGLMQAVNTLNSPQCELLLLRACVGVSRLYFAMRTSPPSMFEEAQLIFDGELRVSLEKVITAGGPGFGPYQWRLATLPMRMGGLGIYNAYDGMQYAFVASRLQTGELQAQILHGADIYTVGAAMENAVEKFKALCGYDALSLNSEQLAPPHFMKSMASVYFAMVGKTLAVDYKLDNRGKTLLRCLQSDHAQDFLCALPIEGIGLNMNPRQFRCCLQYRLGIAMFEEGKLCPSCMVRTMDKFGDHAVHCSADVGVKYRHNAVRDATWDVLRRAGVPAQREVAMGLLGEDGGDLRPADILITGWDRGRDCCIDITGTSPFAGGDQEHTVQAAAQRKIQKYRNIYEEDGLSFAPFSFSTLGQLDSGAGSLLDRVCSLLRSHAMGSKDADHVFSRIGYVIQRGVGGQLVARLPTNEE